MEQSARDGGGDEDWRFPIATVLGWGETVFAFGVEAHHAAGEHIALLNELIATVEAAPLRQHSATLLLDAAHPPPGIVVAKLGAIKVCPFIHEVNNGGVDIVN